MFTGFFVVVVVVVALCQNSAQSAPSDMMIEKQKELDSKVKDIKIKVQVRFTMFVITNDYNLLCSIFVYCCQRVRTALDQ